MAHRLNELIDATRAARVDVQVLSAAETTRLRQKLVSTYADGRDAWPVWEQMAGPGVCDDEARLWIGEFSTGAMLVVFNSGDEKQAVRFYSGADLRRTIAEATMFEFYVTDDEGRFLMCFNHHRYLIAVGSAEEWLAKRIEQYVASGGSGHVVRALSPTAGSK